MQYASPVRLTQPSKPVCELIRVAAEIAIRDSQQVLDAMHEATLGSEYMRAIAKDPVLVEAVRQCNRSNQLHWLAANISHPGEPVPANLGAESLAVVRALIHHGADAAAVVDLYRIGQNVAWRAWMSIAFALTSDADDLHELLDFSAHSITSFIDATIAGICHRVELEREELTSGTQAQRRAVVAMIIDGASITERQAESSLGYQFGQPHTAAVIWAADEANANSFDLDYAVEILVKIAGGRRAFSVSAGSGTRWVWLPGGDGPENSELANIEAALGQLRDVRIALGSTATGMDGFRRSHLDALTTQRTMARLGAARRVVKFADVELVALITGDPTQADLFVKHTLGDFESADEDLQRAVLTFVQSQCNASRAAALLFTHRNTLLRKLSRANELLPRPLEQASLNVAMALEMLQWRRPASQG